MTRSRHLEQCHPVSLLNPFKNSEYDQEIPQSQTADKPMALRGRPTQQSRNASNTNQLERT